MSKDTNSPIQGQLPAWRLAAFAAPCIPVAAMLMPVTLYLPNYYATDLGVGLGAIGFAFAAVRLVDLWLDPMLGFLVDKTNTRFGRFRPWLIAGLPIAVVALWMLFMAQPGIGVGYILLWLIVGFVGQSMASMAHVTWAARIAPEYHQRAQIFGWWNAFGMLGIMIVLALPPLMTYGFGRDHAAGVQAIGWFVILSLPVAIVLALSAVAEPAVAPNAGRSSMRHYLDLLRRPSVLRLLVADIFVNAGPIVAGTLFFFYFDAIGGYDRTVAALFLLLYFLGALAGVPLWTALGRKLGKHRALAVAAIAYALLQISALVAPSGLIWSAAAMAIAGLPFTAGPILLRAMMGDLADEERLISGVDRSGLMFGILNGALKIGTASAVIGATSALQLNGFRADLGAENSPEALFALAMGFAVAPAALSVLGAIVIAGYNLDKPAHDAIRLELAKRDAG
jgi:Na+/melibiose symporter-like transporter